jgi:hypothetical protein
MCTLSFPYIILIKEIVQQKHHPCWLKKSGATFFALCPAATLEDCDEIALSLKQPDTTFRVSRNTSSCTLHDAASMLLIMNHTRSGADSVFDKLFTQ